MGAGQLGLRELAVGDRHLRSGASALGCHLDPASEGEVESTFLNGYFPSENLDGVPVRGIAGKIHTRYVQGSQIAYGPFGRVEGTAGHDGGTGLPVVDARRFRVGCGDHQGPSAHVELSFHPDCRACAVDGIYRSRYEGEMAAFLHIHTSRDLSDIRGTVIHDGQCPFDREHILIVIRSRGFNSDVVAIEIENDVVSGGDDDVTIADPICNRQRDFINKHYGSLGAICRYGSNRGLQRGESPVPDLRDGVPDSDVVIVRIVGYVRGDAGLSSVGETALFVVGEVHTEIIAVIGVDNDRRGLSCLGPVGDNLGVSDADAGRILI